MPDRKTHWDNIYKDKSATDVSWFQLKPRLSLSLIHHAQLSPDDAIIDVGSGASTLVDNLVEAGYEKLSVLDISVHALTEARQRLAEKAVNVEWITQDITDFKPDHGFDLWHDRAVFHFLTDQADRVKYIDVVNSSLVENGQLIIAAFAIGGPLKCSGLDIVQYDATKLQVELGKGFELVEQQDEVHVTPSNVQQEFSYFRFKKLPDYH